MKTIISLALFLIGTLCYSQTTALDNIVGQTIVSSSKIMSDEREIQIYLPEGYGESKINYPVLYLLDGQRYFLHGVSLQKSFLDFKQTSEYIIVGLSKNKSDRNTIYSQNAEKYLSYIKNEVIHYVDQQFRTSETRILFGWAYAGGFAIQTMMNQPNLFTNYIVASPFPLESRIEKFDSLFSLNKKIHGQLFISSETSEGAVASGVQQFKLLLIDQAPESLDWTYKKLENEEHRSTAFTTLYHGLSNYYQYYPELQFNSLKDFNEAGGLKYVYKYQSKRAEQYDLPNELSDWTMFSLTRNAIRANNYDQFEIFINEFSASDFLKRLNINRSISIANFHLEHNQYDQALNLFGILIEQHPASKKPLIGLAETYEAMNDQQNALKYYDLAKRKLD